jgi:hypothetical protein
MLWSKQFYFYEVEEWLNGDPAGPPRPGERKRGRNSEWQHLHNADVIWMPDDWEYPWYGAWDLAKRSKASGSKIQAELVPRSGSYEETSADRLRAGQAALAFGEWRASCLQASRRRPGRTRRPQSAPSRSLLSRPRVCPDRAARALLQGVACSDDAPRRRPRCSGIRAMPQGAQRVRGAVVRAPAGGDRPQAPITWRPVAEGHMRRWPGPVTNRHDSGIMEGLHDPNQSIEVNAGATVLVLRRRFRQRWSARSQCRPDRQSRDGCSESGSRCRVHPPGHPGPTAQHPDCLGPCRFGPIIQLARDVEALFQQHVSRVAALRGRGGWRCTRLEDAGGNSPRRRDGAG